MPEPTDRAERFPLGHRITIEQLTRDPHPALAGLRASEPVSWLPVLSGWLITRHDLALRVMRDSAGFTVDDPRFSTAQVIGPSMLSLDGAEHARHRTPFAAALRPAESGRRFTPIVEAESSSLVQALAARGGGELRRDLAGPLALAVLAESLDLGGIDAGLVMDSYAAISAAVAAITAGQAVPHAAGPAYANLGRRIEQGLRGPSPTSMLARAADSGLTVAEIVSNAAVLMFGGIDTTEGMIANLIVHLLADRSRWQAVLADRSLVPVAVEESMRLEPAAAVIDRYATADHQLAGARIAAGDLVSVSLAGANRDPAVFTDPDRFDLHRPALHRQLAFARGPHFCLGMELARLQARAVLSGLLDALPQLRLAEPGRAHPRGLVFRKPDAVQLRWD